jgi:hypothetical protein
MGGVVSGIVGGIGGLISGNQASNAASQAAAAQAAAAQQAAQMAQFTPVGITTNFGQSNFQVSPSGQVTSAGYTLSPQLQAIQNSLIQAAGQFSPEQINQLIQPIATGASSLFNLGQGYVAQNPQEAAQQYVQQQQALLASSRENQLSNVRNRLFARGRGGLGVQTGTGGAPTSPELQAYYNSLAQQDLALAAQGQQAGMQQAQFGAGLLSGGAALAGQLPALQSAAYAPLQTQLQLAGLTEQMGQQPFLLSQNLAAAQAGAGANAGQLYLGGMGPSIASQYAANSYSPLGSFLSGAGGGLGGLFGGGSSGGGLFGSLGGLFGGGSPLALPGTPGAFTMGGSGGSLSWGD